MAENRQQQGSRKEFFLDLEVPKEVQVGEVFYAKALVSRPGHRLPDRPVRVQFFASGIAFKHPVDAESDTGTASVGMSFNSPGQQSVQAQIIGTAYVSTVRYVNVLGEVKKEARLHSIRTTEIEMGPGEWDVHFIVRDSESKPVKGVIIEILDATLPNGNCKLSPTDESGSTSHAVKMLADEKVRHFRYRSPSVHATKRLWR